jgi:hypothetical protein
LRLRDVRKTPRSITDAHKRSKALAQSAAALQQRSWHAAQWQGWRARRGWRVLMGGAGE